MKALHSKIELFALTLFLGISGCTRQAPQAVLRMRLPTDPPTLDWALASDNVSKEVIQNIQEGLVEHDAQSRVIPSLAKSWERSEDGKTYTFHLRDNLRWSDGAPLTAQHFIDGWERVLNPKTASEYAYFLFDLVGAKEYQAGTLKNFSEVGVRAPDTKTLVVSLRAAASYWIHVPCFWITFPIRKEIIAQFGDKWTDPSHIVTTGPYLLKEWKHDAQVVLERNPLYSRSDEFPKLPPRAELKIIKDDATAVTLFTNHQVDLVRDLPPAQISVLADRPGFKSFPYLRGYYIAFNLKHPDVADVRVRRALAQSINREELHSIKSLQATIDPTRSWIPEGLTGHNPNQGVPESLTEAQQNWKLLPKKPATLEYWFDQKELNRVVAENLQAQWKKSLQLDVQLNNQEWKVYLKTLKSNPPALFRFGWGADYPDPSNFMDLFTCRSGNNFTHFCNSQFDRLVEQAAGLSKESERAALYEKAQKILLEDEVAIIPLFTQKNLYLVSDRTQGFLPNALGDFLFKQLSLTP